MERLVKTLTPVDSQGRGYTELYLYEDGSLGGHVEDATDTAEPRWTLDEARQLQAALGHLIWLAENPDEE